MRIVVSGMVAGDPCQGGATWAVLQYVLGLRALGHEVVLIEPIAAGSIHPAGAPLNASANARYFRHVAASFDLGTHAALLRQDTRDTVGLSYRELAQAAGRADLLINISGLLSDPLLFEPIERRVYLDLDPAFNQLWHSVEGIDVRFAGHTHFVTIGGAIGTSRCAVPTCGRAWIRTLQPIVLERWPATEGHEAAPWTTIGNWRGYGSIRHGGVLFGQKAHSLRRFLGVPTRTREQLLLALAIHRDERADLAALYTNGWHLIEPSSVVATPSDYQSFIQNSKAEFGIAKSGYVESRCGWFSDRSICYLASGRPVLVQDTGLEGMLPAGEGLLTFNTEDEAVNGMESISRDYRRHANAARAIATEYFDARRVLGRLLDTVAA